MLLPDRAEPSGAINSAGSEPSFSVGFRSTRKLQLLIRSQTFSQRANGALLRSMRRLRPKIALGERIAVIPGTKADTIHAPFTDDMRPLFPKPALDRVTTANMSASSAVIFSARGVCSSFGDGDNGALGFVVNQLGCDRACAPQLPSSHHGSSAADEVIVLILSPP